MTLSTRKQKSQYRDIQARVTTLNQELECINNELTKAGLPGELRLKLEKDRRINNRDMNNIKENCDHGLTIIVDKTQKCSICGEILWIW